MHIKSVKNALLFSLLLLVSNLSAEEITVDLVYPKSDKLGQQLVLSGTVKSKQHANVSVLAQGVIETIQVEAGQFVKKGDVLLTLNNQIAQSQLEQADALLQVSEIAYKEANRQYLEVVALSKQQVVAKTLIAERDAAMAKALAQKSHANAVANEKREILQRHTLKAPLSGVITNRFVEVGEWVTPQSSVLTLVSASKLRLELQVPQEFFAYFKAETLPVRITPDMQNTVPFEASITQVISAHNELSRTFTVYIDIAESQGLIAGTSARATIMLPRHNQQTVWLPSSALKHHPDGGYSVFSVTNNIAKRHIVDVVSFRDNEVAISNLSSELAYVINSVQVLQDNSPVVVNSVKGNVQ